MGSFNHKGNLSNLPIEYRDEIVVFVGLRKKCLDTFSLGHSFTPITLPIYGEYNDYGGIMDVVDTPCTEYIKTFFGMSIEELVDLAMESEYDYGEDDEFINKTSQIFKKLGLWEEDYSLGYFMEHKEVFNKMIEQGNETIGRHTFRYFDGDFVTNFLTELGYTRTETSNYNGTWSHSSLPKLIERSGYFSKASDPDNQKYPICIEDLCQVIGCEIPEKYNQSWLEHKFEYDMELSNTNNLNDPFVNFNNLRGCYFINNPAIPGFFYDDEGSQRSLFALPFNTKKVVI